MTWHSWVMEWQQSRLQLHPFLRSQSGEAFCHCDAAAHPAHDRRQPWMPLPTPTITQTIQPCSSFGSGLRSTAALAHVRMALSWAWWLREAG